MGNNGVVSIRVEALGVSITIVDGNIAIEQTKPEIPADKAMMKGVDDRARALTEGPHRTPMRPGKDWCPADQQLPDFQEISGRPFRPRFETRAREILRPSLRVLIRSARTALLNFQAIPVKAKKPGLVKRNRYGAMKKSRS